MFKIIVPRAALAKRKVLKLMNHQRENLLEKTEEKIFQIKSAYLTALLAAKKIQFIRPKTKYLAKLTISFEKSLLRS